MNENYKKYKIKVDNQSLTRLSSNKHTKDDFQFSKEDLELFYALEREWEDQLIGATALQSDKYDSDIDFLMS